MKSYRLLQAALAAAVIIAAPAAWSQPQDYARLSSQYASWAGGKGNADALVTGLRNGTSITLATTAPERAASIAGFTPSGPMSYESISGTLASAKRTLSRMGISQPSAEQMQAALIGGEVTARGATRQVAGVMPQRSAG